MSCNFQDFPKRIIQYGVPQRQSIKPLVRINGIVDELPQGYVLPASILPNLITRLTGNILEIILDSGDCSASTQLELPFLTCEQIINNCLPPQTIDNSTAPKILPNGITLQPTGPNNINVYYDETAFCLAVQACLPPDPPFPVQTINNSLGSYSVAGITFTPTGDNNINISFNVAELCAAISTCLPPVSLQNVIGNLPSWLNATGVGDDVIRFDFDQTGFCQAVNQCVQDILPRIEIIETSTVQGSATLVGTTYNISLNVKVAPGPNAITVTPQGLQVNNCTIGSVVPAKPSSISISSILVLGTDGCMYSMQPQSLELRDCNNALIGNFLVLPA